MPFRSSQYQGTFTPSDLQVLQAAYNRCCALLERCPTTHEDKDYVARNIIRIFEAGESDPEKIAMIAASGSFKRAG